MTSELLVSALPGELRAAVRRDGILDDLLILREGAPGAAAGAQAGDLFLARVQRFDKGLDGAFVALGLERPGLLPRKEPPAGIPPEGSALAVKVLRAPRSEVRIGGKERGSTCRSRQSTFHAQHKTIDDTHR